MAVKYLSRSERDFNVCSDCAYFHPVAPIDKRYPKIVEGTCDKHDGIFDNRWDTDCKDCTANCVCEDCKHFSWMFNEEICERVPICELEDDEINPNEQVCEKFEKYEK